MHGGFSAAGKNNDFMKYDVSKPVVKWEVIHELQKRPGPRAFYSMDTILQFAYMFGGENNREKLDEFWLFDIRREEWSQINVVGARPSSRSFHATTVIGNILFLWGGAGKNGALADFYTYNTDSKEWR
jgi:hypothetical protein